MLDVFLFLFLPSLVGIPIRTASSVLGLKICVITAGIQKYKSIIKKNIVLFWKHKINEIINKFLLAGNKFMPEMYLRHPDLHIVLVDHSLKIKKE